jgi:putative membrane protein
VPAEVTHVKGFLVRWGIGTLALWVATAIVPGMEIHGVGNFFLAALLLGFVNAIVRPILVFLTLPITIVTLGLFLLVVNAIMLEIVAWLFDPFVLHSFGAALLGAAVIGIVSWLTSSWIGPTGRFELLVIEKR